VFEFDNERGTFMAYVDIVTALALIQFLAFGFQVGHAREKHGVKAPAIAGNEIFERYFRVQQNTLESLIVFLPALYVFGKYFDPRWAAALGVVYLVGRAVYAATYVKNPAKRSLGYGLTLLPIVVLLVGSGFGAVRQLVWG
jgi:glutathione S-transferase